MKCTLHLFHLKTFMRPLHVIEANKSLQVSIQTKKLNSCLTFLIYQKCNFKWNSSRRRYETSQHLLEHHNHAPQFLALWKQCHYYMWIKVHLLQFKVLAMKIKRIKRNTLLYKQKRENLDKRVVLIFLNWYALTQKKKKMI